MNNTGRYPLWSTTFKPSLPFRYHVMVPKVNLITKDKKKHPLPSLETYNPFVELWVFSQKTEYFCCHSKSPPSYLSFFIWQVIVFLSYNRPKQEEKGCFCSIRQQQCCQLCLFKLCLRIFLPIFWESALL